jgi:hypothetical protein
MADYHPLIARAVTGLEKNTGENRRALYERARTALVAQLRGVVPALDESEITRERLALEEAIRKVEAESARLAREAPRPPLVRKPEPPRPAEARRPTPASATRPAAPVTPRASRPLVTASYPPPPRGTDTGGPLGPRSSQVAPGPAYPDANELHGPRSVSTRSSLSDEALRGFRDIVTDPHAEHGRGVRYGYDEPTDHSLPPAPSLPSPDQQSLDDYGQLEPQQGQPENLWALPLDGSQAGPSVDLDQTQPPPARQPQYRDEEPEESVRPSRPPRTAPSYGRLIRLALVFLLVGGVAAASYWQRNTIGEAASGLMALFRTPSAPPPREAPASSKITDRIGQPGVQQPSPGVAVAQRVVLYEEDPDDAQGKRYIGTAVWRTELKAAAPGRPPELAVRADIDVPERKMTVTWSLRRNTDQSLPASHTIEIMFNLPPDSPSGGVQNVPGVLMKQAEQTRGVPLAGLAVKVTPGFFLIGLSALETDMVRNLQLLKERAWFDIPIVYNNNRRAILAMEKGNPGEKAFNDAFAAWRQ